MNDHIHPIFSDLLSPFAPRENDEDRFEAEMPRDPVDELFAAGYKREAQMLQESATVFRAMLRDHEAGRSPRPEEWSAARILIARIEGSLK